jgi:hypothetical protein
VISVTLRWPLFFLVERPEYGGHQGSHG